MKQAIALLEIPPRKIIAAIAAAIATLVAGYGLAIVAAWLITTAWTQPPVLNLTVAAVTVRFCGISRGIFRYVERLLTHAAALQGVVKLRTTIFTAMAQRPSADLFRLRRGELLARMGSDADEIGDVVIKAVIPAFTAALMGLLVLTSIAPFSLLAAVFLLLALVLSTLVGPYLAYRAAVNAESATVSARSEILSNSVRILDNAHLLRVRNNLDSELKQLEAAQSNFDFAEDKAARAGAFAAAQVPLAIAISLFGSLLGAGIAWNDQGLSAGIIGILLLAPLSAFEAQMTLTGAATQVARAQASANRLNELTQGKDNAQFVVENESLVPVERVHQTPTALGVSELVIGYVKPLLPPLNFTIQPGQRIAILAPSGTGKTTLLMHLAGLLPPLSGSVQLEGGLPLRSQVLWFAEDAHIFSTSLRENLKVARGDVTDEEILGALRKVGLREWCQSLPKGLDTPLAAGGTSISGGERRRILLARAALCQSPITLLDEPTEHLDNLAAQEVLKALLTRNNDAILPAESTVVVVTHDAANLHHCKDIWVLDENGIAVQGDYETVSQHPSFSRLLATRTA